MTRATLRDVRRACVLSAVFSVCFLGTAVAEEASDTERAPASVEEIDEESAQREAPARLEEITVTGSRLVRDNLGSLGPITILSADEITLSGVSSTEDILRDLPSVGFQGINKNQNNGGGGLSFIDLRNLGSGRTLVLVNGRRFVNGGSGVADAVDINNIPPALLERVEVLRDGVSTIYGADAVAGVVNFVLKDDFEGLQLDVFGGVSDESDGEETGGSVLWGKNWDGANLTLSGTLFSRAPVDQRDRSFARNPIVFTDGIDQVVGSGFVPEGRASAIERDDFDDVFFRPSVNPDGSASSFSSFDFFDPSNPFNFADDSYLIGSVYRSAINASFRYELTESLEFFTDAEYRRRDSEQRLASVPQGGISTRANTSGFTFPVFRDASRNSPFLPTDFQAALFDGLDPSVDQTMLTLSRRFVETGPREFTNESRTLRFVAGLRGDLPGPIAPLRWEVYGNYGRTQQTEFLKNQINLTRALASVQPEVCAQDPACVPGNFFGANSLFSTPDAIPYIRFKSRERIGFHLRQVGASIVGPVLELPAGEVQLAVGAEYREEDGFVSPDPLVVSGDSAGNGLDPTRGNFIIRDLFFESSFPLVAGMRGIEELTLDVSGRYTDSSDFGGAYLSRYGFSYAPVEDFRLRGVYATSFRAPSISDLFGGGADSFLSLRDPCDGFPNIPDPTVMANCAASLPNSDQFTAANPFDQASVGTGGQLRSNIGGNPDLEEERARTINVGFVFQPRFLPDLAVAVDYYDIEIDDPQVNPDPQIAVLNECFGSAGLSSAQCGNITRTGSGGVSLIEVAQTNFGKIETQGIDIDIRYAIDLPVVGPATVSLAGNYVVDFETVGLTRTKGNGRLEANEGSVPNFRARLSTSFNPIPPLMLTATTRFIGESTDQDRREQGLPFDNVPKTYYLDVSARYDITENLTMFLGVRNVTDKEPPFFLDGGTNTNTDTYDVLGRFAFLRLRATF